MIFFKILTRQNAGKKTGQNKLPRRKLNNMYNIYLGLLCFQFIVCPTAMSWDDAKACCKQDLLKRCYVCIFCSEWFSSYFITILKQ